MNGHCVEVIRVSEASRRINSLAILRREARRRFEVMQMWCGTGKLVKQEDQFGVKVAGERVIM